MRRLACVLFLAMTACSATNTTQTHRSTTTTVVPKGEFVLPNPKTTPGVVASLTKTQICKGQYDKRPPQGYTSDLKNRQLSDPTLGYANNSPWSLDKTGSHYEEDHLIPLELGGSGSSQLNLWPEPGPNLGNPADLSFHVNVKDGLENWMYHQVCVGKLDLAKAQHDIATDWIAAWKLAGRPYPTSHPPYYAGGNK